MGATKSGEDSEFNTTLAIFILMSLLYVILWTSYLLQRLKITIIHETVVSIFLGLFVGSIMLATSSKTIKDLVSFDHSYFFNMLLPPIILNSGYDMHRQTFFKNIGVILLFALAGTFISTLVIGVLLYFLVILGLYKFTFLDCILTGAILSSTDPVTILSIFHQLKVDSKLYAIIFGESLLNDSVAIVLFSTLGKLRGQDLTFMTLFHSVLSFFAVFLGSILIGVLIGLLMAAILKFTSLYKFPTLESSIILLQAYSSYLLSNSLKFSGIVSLLFCGIVLKHYAYDNMSPSTKQTSKSMFRVLSQLSENFIFIYLGITLFTKSNQQFYIGLIIFTIAFILLARYLSVIPLAELVNLVSRIRNPENIEPKIPKNHQLMIWWAGLRGAIAFALSYEVQGEEREAIQTTILVVCVASIIILGGLTPLALEKLKIKTGVIMEQEMQYDEGLDDEILSQDSDILTSRVPSHWFLNFDHQYLKPIFSKRLEPSRDASPSRVSLLHRM